MKKIILVAILAVTALASQAQFRFGVKAGLDITSLHFDSSVFDSNNRAGFVGGVMAEFTVPIIGVGCDLSALYVRRNRTYLVENGYDATNNRDYIEIPLNLKYKFSLPVVSKFVRPFLTTGPSVAFMTGHKTILDDAGNAVGLNKGCDWAWNFGLGLELFSKAQVAASYGLGISKAVEAISDASTTRIDGKNRYWTVTLAWLF